MTKPSERFDDVDFTYIQAWFVLHGYTYMHVDGEAVPTPAMLKHVAQDMANSIHPRVTWMSQGRLHLLRGPFGCLTLRFGNAYSEKEARKLRKAPLYRQHWYQILRRKKPV